MSEQVNLATHNQQAGLDPEAEYRQQLMEVVVEESVGSVGVHTALNLDYGQERDNLMRNTEAQGRTLADLPDGYIYTNGWGNYGERNLNGLVSQQNLEDRDIYPRPNHTERVRFVPSETRPGYTDVRYQYYDRNWLDYTHRPNTLFITFEVSDETAASLQTATEQDPTVLDDATKAVVVGMGMSEGYYDRWIGNRRNARTAKSQIEIVSTDATGAVVASEASFDPSLRQSILPAPTSPEGASMVPAELSAKEYAPLKSPIAEQLRVEERENQKMMFEVIEDESPAEKIAAMASSYAWRMQQFRDSPAGSDEREIHRGAATGIEEVLSEIVIDDANNNGGIPVSTLEAYDALLAKHMEEQRKLGAPLNEYSAPIYKMDESEVATALVTLGDVIADCPGGRAVYDKLDEMVQQKLTQG